MSTPKLTTLVTLTALFVATPALAANDGAEPDAGGPRSGTVDNPSSQRNNPMYVAGRASVAVSSNTRGQAAAVGAEFGTMLSKHHSLGLRFVFVDNPPANPLDPSAPMVPWAVGSVIDWMVVLKPESDFSFFSRVGAGYVYGVPEAKGANNVIMPIFETGVGARLSRTARSGSRYYISPEVGLIPGANMPYTGISIGTLLPGSS